MWSRQTHRDRRGFGRARHDHAIQNARHPRRRRQGNPSARQSCPPIRHPCFYGIDFPTSQELIAHNRTVEQIREFLEVDSLAYLSLDGMLSCMKHPREALLHRLLERRIQNPHRSSAKQIQL
jgi:hypothetical protein